MRWWIAVVLVLMAWGLFAQEPGRYSVVIHEIYPDPTPSRGLPSSEFIELRNRSGTDINLRNWSLTNGTIVGKISANYTLRPDSMVVLTTSGALTSYSTYGNSLTLSPFPTLANDGDTLILMSPGGVVIHAIAWDKSWYENEFKEEGGWSLEMKDFTKPCLGKENWTASTSNIGGTPALNNSVKTLVRDTSLPKIHYAYMSDSATVRVVFSEPLNSVDNIQMPQGPSISHTTIEPPFFNTLTIRLTTFVPDDKIFTAEIIKARDCNNNSSVAAKSMFGRFGIPVAGDLPINEVLFNPPLGGSDYVELYNNSNKVIDLSKIHIANRNSNGSLSSIKRISNTPYPLFPGDFALLTNDPAWIFNRYNPGDIKAIMLDLPSFPDDLGSVVLLNDRGAILDELHYSEKWHHPFISNNEGVALERINYNKTTQDNNNWHSASTATHYGTPGYRNSQSLYPKADDSELAYSCNIISPDLDGRDDFLLIQYQFPQPGYIANITAFDLTGKPLKTIAQNALCGTTGYFKWDGVGEKSQKLPKGTYIIHSAFFTITGEMKRFRKTIGIW